MWILRCGGLMFDFYKHRQLSQAGSAGGGSSGGGSSSVSFFAYQSAPVNNVTGDSTAYTVIFDTELYDTGSGYDNTTGIFTAPVTGTYEFNFGIYAFPIDISSNAVTTFLKVNADSYQASLFAPTAGVSTQMCNSGSITVNLAAGDTAAAVINIQSGTLSSGVYGTNVSPFVTWFTGALVGSSGFGGGISSVNSGTNITVNTVGTVATVNLNDIVSLTHADDGSTQGQLQFNGTRFAYNYGLRNTFVGEGSGNTTLDVNNGFSNTGVGYGALASINTGNGNTAIGGQTLANISSGNNATAIGQGAAFVTTNLQNSEVIGVNALGSYNYASPFTEHNMVVIGTSACIFTTTAARDVWIGSRAGFQVQTSDFYNTCVGYQVSYQPTTIGTLNVIMGANSLFSNTIYGDSNVVIGANAGESNGTVGDSNIIIGAGSGTQLSASNSNNIEIGTVGNVADSGAIRVGTSGTHTSCYVQGIASVAVSNTEMVTIDTTTGQLGSAVITAGAINTVNIQTFTADGTYTPTAGMQHCIIEVLGGGGGGGGVAAPNVGEQCAAGGGGAGGYSRIVVSAATIGVSQGVVVGAGGSGGATGANTGTTGSSSSVGALISATGGAGGVGCASAIQSSISGGLGGVGSTGDFNSNGATGGLGFSFLIAGVANTNISGKGADSLYGGGGLSISDVSGGTAGSNATNYGSGGSGAGSAATNGAAGGNGSAGVVIITEFIQA